MRHIATGLLFDKNNKLLIYLRDNKDTIPFPNHWDLFGGYVESGETPEEALAREVQEELGIQLKHIIKFKDYNCLTGDVHPNIKHVYYAKINLLPEQLVLNVGQKIDSINLKDVKKYKFANILSEIVHDFFESKIYKLW